MDAVRRIVTLTLVAFFTVVFAHADIVVGTKRDAVIAELGKPSSSAQRGAREILQYPKNVRLELENGVVVDIKGYSPPAPSTTPKPAAPATPASADDTDDLLEAASGKKPNKDQDFNPAIAANALGDEVAKMETAFGGPAPEMPGHDSSWLELVIGLILRFGYTIVALRIGFKYWEMDAFWSGTLAIAAIDTIIHGVMIALGPVTEGFTTLGGVENAVPWAVMIFTIRHFCFNKRIQNAVLTAGAVKVVAMLCDIFVSIALQHLPLG